MITFARAGETAPRARRNRGPMTPITAKQFRDTFTAPVSNPGGNSRREVWGAVSTDGHWRYERQEDHELNTPWTVTHALTRQVRHGFGTLTEARQATANGLFDEFRAEAARIVLDRHDLPAQRALAIHLRLAGQDAADCLRCVCGGILVTSPEGRTAHLDACDECLDEVSPTYLCPERKRHHFCAHPVTRQCAHNVHNGCTDDAQPNRYGVCGKGDCEDCCGRCCWPGY